MGDDGEERGGEGEGEHFEAGSEDVVLVAGDDAVIDDVGHESWKLERQISLTADPEDEKDDLPPIGLEVFEQF